MLDAVLSDKTDVYWHGSIVNNKLSGRFMSVCPGDKNESSSVKLPSQLSRYIIGWFPGSLLHGFVRLTHQIDIGAWYRTLTTQWVLWSEDLTEFLWNGLQKVHWCEHLTLMFKTKGKISYNVPISFWRQIKLQKFYMYLSLCMREHCTYRFILDRTDPKNNQKRNL